MTFKERVLSSGVVNWRVDHYDYKVIFKQRVLIFGWRVQILLYNDWDFSGCGHVQKLVFGSNHL